MKIWIVFSIVISTVGALASPYDPVIIYFTIFGMCMIGLGIKTQGLKWFKNFY